MKPLELIVYPKSVDHHGQECYVEPTSGELFIPVSSADHIKENTRFSDAEMSAEYYRAKWTQKLYEYLGGEIPEKNLAQVATVERFATTPAYDEAAS